MKLVSTLIFLWFAAFLLSCSPTFPILASAQEPVCGKDAGGAYCPNNECCSNSGQCGITPEYCAPENCQLTCKACGHQTGGILCDEGYCCSNEGFCGTTEYYCEYPVYCQSQCWNSPPPPPPPPPAVAAVCGKDASGAYCPNNECCSNSGQCGTTPEYCAPENCQLSCKACGHQTGGLSCDEGYCCSNEGYCGTTEYYCDSDHCQSQCWTSPPTLAAITQNNRDISTIITQSVFERMLKHRNDFRCQSKGFYNYKAFITAARSFQGFGTTGSIVTRKKELAAFFAQTSALTKGGWPGAPDGLHAWGYCYIKAEGSQAKYYGRGPMQLTHKSMYGLAGQALGIDLIENPNSVATDPVVSFKTAIWFWMTPQKDQPSCHDVITNKWEPSDSDLAAGRVPGYGLITNIINGEDACGRSPNANAADRVQFYKRYCDLLNVNYGDNLDCFHQRPFPKIAMVNEM